MKILAAPKRKKKKSVLCFINRREMPTNCSNAYICGERPVLAIILGKYFDPTTLL